MQITLIYNGLSISAMWKSQRIKFTSSQAYLLLSLKIQQLKAHKKSESNKI